MAAPNFFVELKRRNVYKVAVAYVVVGWLLLQAASILFPTFEAPGWVMKVVVSVIVLGFPVALVIAWAFEMTPDGMKRTENVSPNEQIPQWSRPKFAAFILVVGLLAAALLGFQLMRSKSATSPTASAKSIAVLPFENLSRDPDNAYFADGVQDEILTRLAKIAELKVISRTSTQRYKSSPEDLPKIAQQLGVGHILEGSVQKSGDQVRVAVQLIRAATDSHVWAETYDRKLTDIFAVESEVAENIARSLRVRLTGAERQAVAARPTENPEAYEAYLRGLAYWNKLTTSPEALEKNVLYLDRAVQLDPNFGLAWASLSVAHTFIYAEYERTSQRLAKAKAALDTALRLDPDSGETQFALGMYRYRGRADYEGALAAFQKARQRAANRVEAIEFSAYVKRRQGKWDEALALHAESLQLDPRNPILLSESALTHRAVRKFEEAREVVNRALEIEPTSANLLLQRAELYVAQGDLTSAAQMLERLPFDGQDETGFARIRIWMFEGKYDKAIDTLRKALDAPENLAKELAPSYRAWLGIVESLAGHADAAKIELARAHEELAVLRAEGDTGRRIARDLILTSGFLHDKASVDREALEIQKEIQNDAMDGPRFEEVLAMARAQLGEKGAAISAVKHLLEINGETSLTPAYLRLDPLWNPLRSDPRFQKLANPNP
jgi:TolB-like protein/Tfp pilus assembly protein PilF